ncbi:hypothetical protein VOM14_21825 [Paraburkholderia sp. MPAMCS5]|uniref:hypothetical protein n=1 Tax=Paraburkholderia sp. MPAMCS5 TaxID=3112563 RepID=UPI002E1946ED|nr:hypothetical protein [Paraburkholderia sp. MPAMCS5]
MPFSKRLIDPRRARAMQRLAAAHRRKPRATEARPIRKAGRWATLIVVTALAIAVQRFVANDDVPRELLAVVPPTDCAARYAALLDLAELARRDGMSSEVVMRGLSSMSGKSGAVNACPRLALSGSTP